MKEEREFSRPLGDVAKRRRKELGLTQDQVSDQTGIDHRTILNIENYYGNPKMESLYTLVRFYPIDPREIFFPEMALETPVRENLRLLIETCTEEEAELLIPILRSILEALHAKDTPDFEEAT